MISNPSGSILMVRGRITILSIPPLQTLDGKFANSDKENAQAQYSVCINSKIFHTALK